MKFNPECNKESLALWLENTGSAHESTHFGLDWLDQREINIDGMVSARQVEILHKWFEAHKGVKL